MMTVLIAASLVSREFVFQSEKPLKSVHLAGTFNGWNASAMPMLSADGGKTWKVTARLPHGRHEYKLVLDGQNWIIDPKNPHSEMDGGGHTNSILMIDPEDYSQPAKTGDGIIAWSTFEHLPEAPFVRSDGDRLQFSLRIRPSDAAHVWLEVNGKRFEMSPHPFDRYVESRTVEVKVAAKGSLDYRFVIQDGAKTWEKPYRLDLSQFPMVQAPRWAEGQVLYQIFPERFSNGNPTNDPGGKLAWNADPTFWSFHGGDLAGVRDKVGHLEALGINGIYFNPLFKSPSNHGYDTTDYLDIDPRYGTKQEFRDLVQLMQNRGMKVVLDGVFNHTAPGYPAFDSILKNGAESPFKDWYFIKSFPVQVKANPPYQAWNNFAGMPKLNLSHEPAARAMLDAAKYWIDYAKIDGWRLDVANEVSPEFWRRFRREVKRENPNTWILGEVWTDARPWLKGDQWDSAMGYQFRGLTVDFVAGGKGTAEEYLAQLQATYNSYPTSVGRSLMNLLSSHDTPRFITLCKGDAKLAALGALVQLTWPGTPSIYYGEEIGMEGGPDPANRRGMEWDKRQQNQHLFQTYQKLIRLRNQRASLRRADPILLKTGGDPKAGAFARGEVIVAFNRSEKPQTLQISLPAQLVKSRYRDELHQTPVSRPTRGSIRLTLPSFTGAVLTPNL